MNELKGLFSLKIKPRETLDQLSSIVREINLLANRFEKNGEFTNEETIKALEVSFWLVFLMSRNLTIAFAIYTLFDPSFIEDAAKVVYSPVLSEEAIDKLFGNPKIIRYSLGAVLLRSNLELEIKESLNAPFDVWRRHMFFSVKRLLTGRGWKLEPEN